MYDARIEQAIVIDAPASVVWENLTRIELMKEWMGDPEMALEIETDWTVGHQIVISGFHHVRFKNRGRVVAFEPMQRLAYTHLSSLSRLPEVPGSYTMLEFTLAAVNRATALQFQASGFPTESIFKHLQFYWGGTLPVLKRTIEQRVSSV
ncbi:SRPBCC domain-containing protein [Steroidobacter flavus]|uniref:SRPBCC domain-containing protein n=1 Tax=Steroidobacter flavus TaxID=1842136 RepID=A0ABV8SVX5_9GAMM